MLSVYSIYILWTSSNPASYRLKLDNPAELSEAQLNWEDIKEWIETDFDVPTGKNVTDEAIMLHVVNPTASQRCWSW